MLRAVGEDEYLAECEDCGTRMPLIGPHLVVVAQLMKNGWLLRDEDGVTSSWCAACGTKSSFRKPPRE